MPSEMPQNDDLPASNSCTRQRLAAVFGLLGVALGAFGAHGLEKAIDDPDRLAIWDTAVFYHLIHAVMLFVVASAARPNRAAWNAYAIGIIIFSGSLYVLVLSDLRWFGAITPIGGVALLVGWGMLIFRPKASS